MSGTRLFGKRSKPYPDVRNCLGASIGLNHDREWWHAIGQAKETFEATKPDILEQLRTSFTDSYCSPVQLHLYMIGRCAESARPTIMFFCEDKEPRKKAKKTIDDSGLMRRLPGFRTGHQARQPSIGRLVLPATSSDNFDITKYVQPNEVLASKIAWLAKRPWAPHEPQSDLTPYFKASSANAIDEASYASAREVYYDTSLPLKADGTAIFVKHEDGVFRRATAYAVSSGSLYYLMTVSHVFFNHGQDPSVMEPVEEDRDFDLGSDTEIDDQEDLMEITSLASVSSNDDVSSADPDSISPEAESLQSTIQDDVMEIDQKIDTYFPVQEPIAQGNKSAQSERDSRLLSNIKPENLLHLGTLCSASIDQDSALISIASKYVLHSIKSDLLLGSGKSRHQVATHVKNEEVLVKTNGHGKNLTGRISGSSSHLRLPRSSTFQEVYHIVMDRAIDWGDCGAVALSARTHNLYGHIVASSEERGTVFIIPAHRVFGASGVRWETMVDISVGTTRRRKTSRDSSRVNLDSGNSFKFEFITAMHPKQFKDKGYMTSVRKKTVGQYLVERNKPKATTGKRIAGNEIENTRSYTSGASSASESWDKAEIVALSRSTPANSIPVIMPFMVPARSEALSYESLPTPLFVSVGKALNSFQTMFQSSHPVVSVEELKRDFMIYFGTRAMNRIWIPEVLNESAAFFGTLCMAAAYNDVVHQSPQGSVQTIALRQEVIHRVSRNLLDPTKRASDANVMAITHLIASELIFREEMRLQYHEDGIESMVRHRGGLSQLGLQGRLASIASWLSLQASISRENRPRSMYAEYCEAESSKDYPEDTAIPESPLYCPRGIMQTLRRSRECSGMSLALLMDVHTIIETCLLETKWPQRPSVTIRNLYERIGDPNIYPSTPERLMTTSAAERMYEPIRLTALLISCSFFRQEPLSEAADHLQLSNEQPPKASELPSDYFSSVSLLSQAGAPKTDADSNCDYLPSESFGTKASPWSSFRPSISSYSASDSSRSGVFSNVMSNPRIRPNGFSASNEPEHSPFTPPYMSPQSNKDGFLQSLRSALEKSDLSNCWSEMAGVLLWIALTASAATRGSKDKLLQRYFSALAVRVAMMLGFEHPEAINATHIKMVKLQEALRTAVTMKEAKPEEEVKKERV